MNKEQLDFLHLADSAIDPIVKQNKTNYKDLKSKSLNQLAVWFSENFTPNSTPWTHWILKEYCHNCKPINGSIPCNVGEKCPQGLNILSNTDLIKMWLKGEHYEV